MVGQHHRLFCEPEFARSAEYVAFWTHLASGQFHAGEFKRLAKTGEEVWIQASYNPILDAHGKAVKVVKFATDITAVKRRNAEFEGKLQAISRSQVVVEFDLQGQVLDVNSNFLRVLGYTPLEVIGQHHRLFCEESLIKSPEYRHFWANLSEGQFQAGRFKRLGKHGIEVWIQATYNPVLDANGKVCKVVKYAVDITGQVDREQLVREKVSAISDVLEELSASIDNIAKNAARSSELAQTTQHEAGDGTRLLARSRESIMQIQNSSRDIHDIIKTIGDIAAQTNLLAFNAAIEAARAGEQGRGFAVVADEVRKLAERTAMSTQEISSTVQAILDETGIAVKRMQSVSTSMSGSVGLAREAGNSLATIDEHAQQTVDTVKNIADSTREQSSASQEIARLVENIAQMAEGSSSRAVNNTERAQNLQRLAAELQAQLSRFTT